MLRTTLLTLFLLALSISKGLNAAETHKEKQTELDLACEEARQIALEPMRKELYQECTEKFKKSTEECEKQANAYNGTRGNGSLMFYDLPECEIAFEYKTNYRKSK